MFFYLCYIQIVNKQKAVFFMERIKQIIKNINKQITLQETKLNELYEIYNKLSKKDEYEKKLRVDTKLEIKKTLVLIEMLENLLK